ncbi:MAG: glycosyltransferase family 4 protein [Myxococcales bacterium]|nr:glycosyltransferase family 4 protein [Myxococcales bacterium]
MRLAIPLSGTDRGRSGLGAWVHAVLPRLIAALGGPSDDLQVIGTQDELDAYAPYAAGATRIVLPSWAGKPAVSAALHLLAVDRLARARGAEVLLMPSGNRRFAYRPCLPTVTVVHDLAFLQVARKFGWLRDVWVSRVLPAALEAQTQLVAISQSTRRDLSKVLRTPRDVLVVPNGVEAERFADGVELSARVVEVRRRYGLVRPFLIYGARLELPGKNHLRLLDAFASVSQRHGVDLVLAGADWGAEAAVRAAVTRLGLEGRVKLLGFVPRSDLEALVKGATALACVGLYEGFGLPALEALAAGVPPVVSTTGALPEVVGPLGVLCDPHDVSSMTDALDRVLTDEGVQSRARLDGPLHAATFSWDATAAALVRACREAMGASS